MTLDQLDLKIINHLTHDGRASGEKIAHDLGIDQGTCRFRMRRLIGGLVQVKAFVNPSLVGFPISAFLGFKVQPTEVTAAADKLARHRRIVQVNALSGMFDVVGLAVFRSGRDVTSVMQELYDSIEGVREIQAIMCLETTLGFHVRVSPELLFEPDIKTDLDDVDKRVIATLIDDGRLNARDMARMLSIGEASARRRLKQLIDKKVIAVSAVADAASIGFPVVAMIGFKVELPQIREVAAALANHHQINYVTSCAGVLDILAAGMFRSTADLRKTLQEFVSQVDGIRDTQTFVCFEESTGRSLWVPRALVPEPEDQQQPVAATSEQSTEQTAEDASPRLPSAAHRKEGKRRRRVMVAR